jgi:hypothetical protein
MLEKPGNKKPLLAGNEAGLTGTDAGALIFQEDIQDTLDFIDDFFDNYFGEEKKVPFSYLKLRKEDLRRQTEILDAAVARNEVLDKSVTEIVISSISKFLESKARIISYRELAYKKELLKVLLLENSMQSTFHLREALYSINYNEDNFIAYEFSLLRAITETVPTKKEKIALLKLEQKAINQFPLKIATGFSANMPALKQQINSWIDEEIKYLASDFVPDPNISTATENENKIHTSLSVAKLALIMRILVVDKIIINKKIVPMLRVAARTFTSLQKEDIASGSLETKYHAPDKATINTLKEMLHKWLAILNRL